MKCWLQWRLTTYLSFFPQCSAAGAVVCAVRGADAARALKAAHEHPSTRRPKGGIFMFRRIADWSFGELGSFFNSSYECFYSLSGLTSFTVIIKAQTAKRETAARWASLLHCSSDAGRLSGAAACPRLCVLYAQHAAPIVHDQTHLRVRAPWSVPAASTERHGS